VRDTADLRDGELSPMVVAAPSAIRDRPTAVAMHEQHQRNTRMLVVTPIPETFAAFLTPYARHLARRGWSVDLATGPGDLSGEAAAVVSDRIEVPWCRSVPSLSQLVGAGRVMRDALRHGRYDVVHVHTPIAAAVARASIASMRRRHRPRVVYTAHGFHFGTGRGWGHELPFQVAEWLAGRYTDRLIVINETDRRNAERLHIVRRGRVIHLPGIGLDLAWYDRSEALLRKAVLLRAEMGLPDTSPLFSVIAALHPGKGHHDALVALTLMRRADAHLVFAGSGVLHADLEEEITRHHLGERVHLLGEVDDVRPLMLASAATVLPSAREGLSRAVLESLALGVPVVGSDIRGIADTVRPGGGTLVPPHDVRRLAAALDAVADRPPLDAAGRARLRDRLAPYSIDALLTAHDGLYDELLAVAAR